VGRYLGDKSAPEVFERYPDVLPSFMRPLFKLVRSPHTLSLIPASASGPVAQAGSEWRPQLHGRVTYTGPRLLRVVCERPFNTAVRNHRFG